MTFDALQFCIDYDIPYYTEGKNVTEGWVNIQCPLCEDAFNHGGFNPEKGYYHCWRCGGHSLKYIVWVLTKEKDTDKIIEEYSDEITVKRKEEKEKPIVTHVDMPGEDLQWYHKAYLRSRNFNPEYLEQKYYLKGTTPSFKFGPRIYTPIYYNGDLVSYQGRSIKEDDSDIKYLTAASDKEKILHKDILFNLDNCIKDYIVVVEGVYDVFRLGDNSCASFGISFTQKQLQLLSQYKRIYFVYDTEERAQKAAEKAGGTIALFSNSYVEQITLDGSDPGDMSDEDAEALMKELT